MNIVVKLSFWRYFLKEVLPCQISSQSIMVLAYYQWHTGRRFEDIVKDGLTLSTVMSMKLMKTNSSRQQTKFSPETKPAEKPNCMKSEKHAALPNSS